MSKFLLPILAGVVMVIISGCGGAGAPSTDETETDDKTNPAGPTPEQMEAKRLADLRAKLLTDETTACGGTCASYAEWLTANPNLRTTPIETANRASDNNRGHYLQGTATGLNAGNAVVTTVTFNDAFEDDNTFDGFAYFSRIEKRRYVGILSDTNMGAPLTTTVGRAIWPAFIASGKGIISEDDALTTPTAFDLMVNFNATGGTINGFIPTTVSSRIAFRIVGEFDAKGVITGITDRRTYRDNTDVRTYEPASIGTNTVGTLRGLIGLQGAVGVFTTDAEDAFVPYAGGFVAKPAPLLPGADHALYVSAFSPPPAVADLTKSATFEIAQPTAEGFSATGLRFEKQPSAINDDCNSCVNNFIARLGGDNADTADRNGFAVLYGRFTSGSSARLRAGLLPGTDVGASFGNVAPDGATTASWPGTIYHLRHLSGAKPNQVLVPYNVAFAVDFAAGTFELPSTVLTPGGAGSIVTIRVAGRFGSHVDAVNNAATPARLPAGVLGGNAYHKIGFNGEVTHALQGLIGTEGAVAVFRSSTDQSTFGGLVAAPPPPPDPCVALGTCPAVEFAAWEASFGTNAGNEDETLQESGFENESSGNDNYIKVTITGQIVSGTDGEQSLPLNVLRLNDTSGEEGYESGVSYAFNMPEFNDQGYAGLLPTTNLGAPLTDNTKNTIWTGKLGGRYSGGEGAITPGDFSLQVTYGVSDSSKGSVGTITTVGSNSMKGSTTVSATTINVDGYFNAAGVMWGAFAVGDEANNNASFSGLIGEKGAVGVFKGSSRTAARTGYAGGFFVKPPAQ